MSTKVGGGGPASPGDGDNQAQTDLDAGDDAGETNDKSEGTEADEANEGPDDEDSGDNEAEEINLSLAAMEAELMPEVIKTFERITSTYTKLHRLQVLRREVMQKGKNLILF